MKKISKVELYPLNGIRKTNEQELICDFEQASIEGVKQFVIEDISKKTTGFIRGAKISNIVRTLKHLQSLGREKIELSIMNTNEDISFYKQILKSVPGLKLELNIENMNETQLKEWKEIFPY